MATAALSMTATLMTRTRRMTCDDGLYKDDARCRSMLPRILPRAASAGGRGARPSVVALMCRMRVRGAYIRDTTHAVGCKRAPAGRPFAVYSPVLSRVLAENHLQRSWDWRLITTASQ